MINSRRPIQDNIIVGSTNNINGTNNIIIGCDKDLTVDNCIIIGGKDKHIYIGDFTTIGTKNQDIILNGYSIRDIYKNVDKLTSDLDNIIIGNNDASKIVIGNEKRDNNCNITIGGINFIQLIKKIELIESRIKCLTESKIVSKKRLID